MSVVIQRARGAGPVTCAAGAHGLQVFKDVRPLSGPRDQGATLVTSSTFAAVAIRPHFDGLTPRHPVHAPGTAATAAEIRLDGRDDRHKPLTSVVVDGVVASRRVTSGWGLQTDLVMRVPRAEVIAAESLKVLSSFGLFTQDRSRLVIPM